MLAGDRAIIWITLQADGFARLGPVYALRDESVVHHPIGDVDCAQSGCESSFPFPTRPSWIDAG